jgi:uncharacterized protein YndB with AHSA1/START domain
MSEESLDLVVTRRFHAPVELLWDAWTRSEDVKRWWGPAGFTSPMARMDVRVGGRSLVSMRSPDGHDLYNSWTYRAIVPLQRLEFVLNFADADGNILDPASMGLPPGIPRDVPHVVTLEATSDGQTEMSVTESGYTTEQVVEISRNGLNQSLDKLAASLTER